MVKRIVVVASHNKTRKAVVLKVLLSGANYRRKHGTRIGRADDWVRREDWISFVVVILASAEHAHGNRPFQRVVLDENLAAVLVLNDQQVALRIVAVDNGGRVIDLVGQRR